MSQKAKPAYQHHRGSGQAKVRIDGKDIYLGKHGTPESYERYEDVIADWMIRNQNAENYSLRVDELALMYVEHVDQHYRKNGKHTSEVSCIRAVLRRLIKLHGRTRAREFGPRALKQVRETMIEDGRVRTKVNSNVGRIRRMFKWAAENEYVPATVYQALTTVSGLQYGRTKAAESDPVRPVPSESIDAIRDEVSPQVWAMIQLQLFTGMRPGEVIQMRGCDLNQDGVIWECRPESHKTEHRGRDRCIFLGPQAQEVVRPFFKSDPNAYLFSPAEVRAEFDAERRQKRKSPMTPSHRARKPKPDPRWKPGQCYSVAAYRRAICRACERAFGMPQRLRRMHASLTKAEREQRKREASEWRAKHCWHPHQLRHNAATEIRRQFGIEAARTVLGHSSAVVTEIYAEMDYDTARKVIGQVG